METSERLNFAGELGARAHSELGVDVGQVARYRPLAEEQCGGYFPIRPTLRNQGGDAALGRRQPFLACAPPDASELVTRLADPGDSPELLKAAERFADRVAGAALLACAPVDDPKRKQRSRAAEGITDLLVLRDRSLEEESGATDVTLGARDQTAASRHVREHPLASHPDRVRVPEVKDSHGVVDPAELEEKLDIV